MTNRTKFEEAYGFRRSAVALANWRTAPFNRWSFLNVGELVPSARIEASSSEAEPAIADFSALLGETLSLSNGTETVAAFLDRSSADALTVMKGGRFIGDWFAPHMQPGNRHIIFSISKSLTAILAGILEGEGRFDPEAPVTAYIPEATGSAYGDATVRHVLDMTVSLDFEEAYLDPESSFARYRRATLWNPGGGDEGLEEFLLSIKRRPEPHGDVFRYRSPNSDLLGVLVERASGKRVPELFAEKLWAPLGARGEGAITVDRVGTARTAGGISMTPRDLARVGEMMRQGGVANGKRVVSETWVRDTTTAGSLEAWKRGDFAHLFAQGRYRNKWYQSGKGSYCGIGIHGQWLFVDPASEVVIVKMSSQPTPVDDPLDHDNVDFFEALVRMV
ncbi:MAG: serine hydrolase [Aquamicrobium sp.]|uniref:serine hydrolase domain-containing protein n=1 Tax=Mesorhizobium sp. Pch-S TaxID=2082387 RepID=UPI001012A43A|nr:serine hydrolase [Mesorhizobium sp. Pch-S]MBR2686458.1 serine hydrolase [Aquamicrobium sp.]QAZ47319.1 6-aminohexanoate hydrolase [Mesorhizobium sp. Pch-S]